MTKKILAFLLALSLTACSGFNWADPFRPDLEAIPTLGSLPEELAEGTSQPVQDGVVDGSEDSAVFLPENVVLVYRREGGFAGTAEQWRVASTGLVIAQKGPAGTNFNPISAADTYQVETGELETLQNRLVETGLASLPALIPEPVPCCDRFVYTLTVRVDGEVVQVSTYDGAEDVPPEVSAAVEVVQTFIDGLK
jgi:hypothetical protein